MARRDGGIDRSTLPPVILIVDDDPDMLILLYHLMHHLALTYGIIAVGDAQSALNRLAQRTVPLLSNDRRIPLGRPPRARPLLFSSQH